MTDRWSTYNGKNRNPCPYNAANWLSKITSWWLNPLFQTGYKKKLTQCELFDVLPEDESSLLSDKVERCWEKELKSEKPNLFKAVLFAFKWECLLPGLFLIASESLTVIQPYLIGNLIGYFDPNIHIPKEQAYVYAVLLSLCGILQITILPLYFFQMEKVAMQMRAAVSGVIYRKVLKISCQSLHNTTSGQIFNFISTDVEKFGFATQAFHFFWIAPVHIAVVFYLIYRYTGFAAFFILAAVSTVILLQFIVAQQFGRLRMLIAACSDKRIHLMNQILAGMRVIKMYCWEKPFGDLIVQLRKSEIKYIGYDSLAKAVNIGMHLSIMKCMQLLVFVVSWKLQNKMSSEIVFSIIGWLETLRLSFYFFSFFTIANITQLASSLKRIQRFLVLDDFSNSSSEENESKAHSLNCASDVAVGISNMYAFWEIDKNLSMNQTENQKISMIEEDSSLNSFGLKNISLEIKKGELIAVVGSVGAGKSTLLQILMGELVPQFGSIVVSGTLGYVSQQPWVFSGTVKQNVLFGRPFDPNFYRQIIGVCALKKDIDLMPNGHETLVGERGLLLSGGQKARLGLARCLYRKADVYLFDDPLSAVDAGVGRHLFNECIYKHLQDSTRILVTHQLQYLKNVDRIVIINQGRVADVGSYDELISRGTEFSRLMPQNEKHDEPDILTEIENAKTDRTVKTDTTAAIEDEDISEGSVGFNVYKQYLKSSYGALSVPLILLFGLISGISTAASDWFLAKWSQAQEEESVLNSSSNPVGNTTLFLSSSQPCISCTTSMFMTLNNSMVPEFTNKHGSLSDTLMNTYISLNCYFFGLIFLTTVLFFFFSLVAGQRLHNKMFNIVLQARSNFFDANPVGRILNRFARDIGFIDDSLPRIFWTFFELAIRIIVMLVVICIINPWLLLPLLPLVVIVVLLYHYAVQTTRDTKRLEAVARSPVYSHLSDTLLGLQTIRSQGMEKQFVHEFDDLQNCHTSAFFIFLVAYRWFNLRSLCIVIIFMNFTIYLSLILKDSLDLRRGMVGLSLSYCIVFARPFEYWIRMTAELEHAMTSVERVVSYTNLEQEAEKKSARPPPKGWPHLGIIIMNNLSLRYSEDSPQVLKHINCTINSHEKIGIVGRTGTGKSSLLASLLRLYEPTGSIVIDGIDVLKIGLHELRSKISVIPQDPVLFSGSLRKNLDPFDEFGDQELWDSLKQVQLKEKVDGLDGKLYMKMEEYGVNFSVGQRQLVCVARAILRYNRILVLDEATANVDNMTDELIQKTIRENFKNCTVLTVAHRLQTIIDSDRVMVLENGELIEFDNPYNLLQNKQGIFYNMVQQTGETQAKQLLNLARHYYKD